jgi:hypothetical protein
MILIYFADAPGDLTAKCSLISGQFRVMIRKRFVNWNARSVLELNGNPPKQFLQRSLIF